jgi:hypothetical protein
MFRLYIRSHHQAGYKAPNKNLQKYNTIKVVGTRFRLFIRLHLYKSGRDSSVGVATGYGLDGPGIESRWRRDFSHASRPALGPTQPPVRWVPGVKQPGRGADHPPPSSAEFENG